MRLKDKWSHWYFHKVWVLFICFYQTSQTRKKIRYRISYQMRMVPAKITIDLMSKSLLLWIVAMIGWAKLLANISGSQSAYICIFVLEAFMAGTSLAIDYAGEWVSGQIEITWWMWKNHGTNSSPNHYLVACDDACILVCRYFFRCSNLCTQRTVVIFLIFLFLFWTCECDVFEQLSGVRRKQQLTYWRSLCRRSCMERWIGLERLEVIPETIIIPYRCLLGDFYILRKTVSRLGKMLDINAHQVIVWPVCI